jgi:hypothetical protein
MCLEKQGDFKISHYIGYQIFKEKRGRLYPLIFDREYELTQKRKTVPIGVWEIDRNIYQITNENGIQYPAGFHILLSIEEAIKFNESQTIDIPSPILYTEVLKKVKFSKVVAKGYQDGVRVVVAKKRMVIPDWTLNMEEIMK